MLCTSLFQLSLPLLRHNPLIGLQLFWLAKYGCVTGTVLVLCTGHFILHTIYYDILFVALFRSLFLICFYLCRNTSSHELMFLFDNSTVNKDSCILYLVSCGVVYAATVASAFVRGTDALLQY